jgi:hypothetical protein
MHLFIAAKRIVKYFYRDLTINFFLGILSKNALPFYDFSKQIINLEVFIDTPSLYGLPSYSNAAESISSDINLYGAYTLPDYTMSQFAENTSLEFSIGGEYV